MPILPSVSSIDRPTPRPQRGVVVAQPQLWPSGIEEGRALAVAGQQLAGMGEAIAEADARLTSARRGAQMTQAVGQATFALGELEAKYKRDQDFKTSPTRFAEEAELVAQQISKGIDDDVVKQAFSQRYRELAQAKRLNVLTAATVQEGDFNKANLEQNLDLYATAAANASNPAERAIIENQARVAISEMRTSGWITDVDAVAKSKGFFSKVDQAIVTRDMTADPFATATKLATDAEYAKGLDPLMRERLIDASLRRAESERTRQEAEQRRQQAAVADAGLKDAYDLLERGALTRAKIAELRPILSPGEYHSLLSAVKNQGKDGPDNSAAFADLQAQLYPAHGGPPDLAAVKAAAFAYQKTGRIKDSTLAAVLTRAEELSRREGPRSPYERNKAFLIAALEPSQMTMDPAPKARQGLAIREFDDWFASREKSPPTEKEMQDKANEIVKKNALVDMTALARRTGMGGTSDPKTQLDALKARETQLQQKLAAKQISQDEFTRQMGDLNKLRKAAEMANGGR